MSRKSFRDFPSYWYTAVLRPTVPCYNFRDLFREIFLLKSFRGFFIDSSRIFVRNSFQLLWKQSSGDYSKDCFEDSSWDSFWSSSRYSSKNVPQDPSKDLTWDSTLAYFKGSLGDSSNFFSILQVFFIQIYLKIASKSSYEISPKNFSENPSGIPPKFLQFTRKILRLFWRFLHQIFWDFSWSS